MKVGGLYIAEALDLSSIIHPPIIPIILGIANFVSVTTVLDSYFIYKSIII